MGVSSWENAPDGKVLIPDVSVANNYLSEEELQSLGSLVNVYLELAEERARRRIPMTVEDWAKRLDQFLEFTDYKLLQGPGLISTKKAKAHAESQFENYRTVQDSLFESDAHRVLKALQSVQNPPEPKVRKVSPRPGKQSAHSDCDHPDLSPCFKGH